MEWHVSRPTGNWWDDYLMQTRNAALRATEPEAD